MGDDWVRATFPFFQKNVSGGLCPLKVGRDGADNHRTDPALAEQVVLYNNMWMPETKSGAGRNAEVNPENIPLADNHLSFR